MVAQRPSPNGLGSALKAKVVELTREWFGLVHTRDFEHFVYQLTIPSAAADALTEAGQVLTQAIQISAESHFVCTQIQCGARIGAAHGTLAQRGIVITAGAAVPTAGDLPDAPFLLQIIDAGSSRQMHSAGVDAGLTYSTAGRPPVLLARPRLFEANSGVTVQLTTLKRVQNTAAAASITDYRVNLVGYKLYLKGR